MKWFWLVLMLVIIVPGLYYTGFVPPAWMAKFSANQEQNVSKLSSNKLKKDIEPSVSSSYNIKTTFPSEGQLKTLKGKAFSFESLRGKIVLLNFWASWCLPCYEEFPELIKAVQWSEGEIVLVAVSVDAQKKDIHKFFKILKQKTGVHIKDKNIYILWDPEWKMAKLFHTIKLPETFILNKDLEMVKKQVGAFSFKKTKVFLQKIL